MSIDFEKPMNEEEIDELRKIFGKDLDAVDAETALLSGNIDCEKTKKLANEINQVVTVELNDVGDIKTMSDGTKYRCTPRGWIKI